LLDPFITFLIAVLLCIGGVVYVCHMAKLEGQGRLKRGPGRLPDPKRPA